ncbi:MAG: DUF368 domain-containing protein [Pirellulales bacterium]|nr:DUF368 domain-containing protein [Pirellulales bacterium]
MIRPERNDLAQLIRGFLMGGADIIPGVSGGTVALILGIYQRLVTAISHADGHLLSLLVQRQWRTAAEYLDLRFLVGLGVGILTGIGCLAGLMHTLLGEYRSFTLAVFFGLILGSSLIVARMVQPRGTGQGFGYVVLAAAAAGFAYWLVGLDQFRFHDHLGYFFGCGAIAICAMILPGISGAYILWLLGAYVAVTGIIHSVLSLQVTQREFVSLVVFACGCAVGLVSFSKLLKWLLEHARAPVMAILGGFMIGSLRLMWPFQHDLTPEKELKFKEFETYVPVSWDHEITACLLLAVGATLAVSLLERWGRNQGKGQ